MTRDYESGETQPNGSKHQVEPACLSAAALAAAVAAVSGVACSSNALPGAFSQLKQPGPLTAISDQIIPPDQAPSASWAGVVRPDMEADFFREIL